MGSNVNKYGGFLFGLENRSIIPCYVDASASWERPPHGMIVQGWIERVVQKYIKAFLELLLDIIRQFAELLFEIPMEDNPHDSTGSNMPGLSLRL